MTVEPLRLRYKKWKDSQDKIIEEAIVDRGYRWKKKINGTQIIFPDPLKGDATADQKRKMRGYFRRRAAIEPVIGHMKKSYRMKRNYLKGVQGDVINAVMAGAAFNFKRWLNQKLKEVSGFIQKLFSSWFEIGIEDNLFSPSC